MNVHRGLTLLEVLIATALLAVMAAACVPVMAQAMRALAFDDSEHELEIDDLARFADALLVNPESFGLKGPHELLDSREAQLEWPADLLPGRSAPIVPVQVRVLRNADASEADHAWLVFECDGVVVHRWLEIPAPKEVANP